MVQWSSVPLRIWPHKVSDFSSKKKSINNLSTSFCGFCYWTIRENWRKNYFSAIELSFVAFRWTPSINSCTVPLSTLSASFWSIFINQTVFPLFWLLQTTSALLCFVASNSKHSAKEGPIDMSFQRSSPNVPSPQSSEGYFQLRRCVISSLIRRLQRWQPLHLHRCGGRGVCFRNCSMPVLSLPTSYPSIVIKPQTFIKLPFHETRHPNNNDHSPLVIVALRSVKWKHNTFSWFAGAKIILHSFALIVLRIFHEMWWK